MDSYIPELLYKLMSSDNNVRIESEINFKHLMESNPDQFMYNLIQIALNSNVELSIRQSCLLYLKRMVPRYWSPAFETYIGSNTTNQEVKKMTRDSLISLIADPDSKIRSGAGYAIAQIAAVDYPDEWPDLLLSLYNGTINSESNMFQMIGSLSVLHEIFDDVVTEEQFFEGGAAEEIIQTCQILLTDSSYNLEVKVEASRLLKAISETFESSDLEINERESFTRIAVPKIIALLSETSKNVSNIKDSSHILLYWDLKAEVYDILDSLLNSFSYMFKYSEFSYVESIIFDLLNQQPIYELLTCQEVDKSLLASTFIDIDQFSSMQRERREPLDLITGTISQEIDFLGSLIEIQNLRSEEKLSELCNILISLSILPVSKLENYISDFNEYVSDETGLSVDYSIRESCSEFTRQLNELDNSILIKVLSQKLVEGIQLNFKSLHSESIAFLLTSSFDNDFEISKPSFDLKKFLEYILNIIDQKTDKNELHDEVEFLVSRFVIMLPKFLMKYQAECEQFGVPSLTQLLINLSKLGNEDDHQLLKSSILISFQYFNHFIRANQFDTDIQSKLISLIYQLKTDSDEDSNIMILESLSILICIDNKALSYNSDTLMLALTIGFKDCSNFSLNTSTLECVQDSIKNLPLDNYMNLASKTLPHLLEITSKFNGQYSPEIDLTLQVIAILIKVPPGDFHIPQEIFQCVFPVLCKFILDCNDDQLLQSASETLNVIVAESSKLINTYSDTKSGDQGTYILLKIVSKFLSPNMSDRAVAKLGDLVMILLENFSESLHSYLEDIFKGLTIRLIAAKEVPTIENMILIFNILTIAQPKATINFLKSFPVDSEPALVKILPIWFQAYEVMRGYDSILSNVRAFIEIYKLSDPELKHSLVNGEPLPNQIPDDVIVTRSMSRKTPIKYERIPADVKIIRLLVGELRNEVNASQKGEGHLMNYHHEAGCRQDADDEDDGWEDLDNVGVPNFDQLKEYVDDEEEFSRGMDRSSDETMQYLIRFFKECTVKNIADFEEIYKNYLNDVDRKVLTESLVFT